MMQQLKLSYQRQLLPPLAATAVVMIAQGTHLAAPAPWIDAPAAGPWLFTLSVVFAGAAPVFLRTLFAHRMRRRTFVPEADFYRFQRQVIHWGLLTPYLACGACLLALPQFYFTGVALATLYAIYYTYPSQRRIAFEQRIFRVGKGRDA
ncbi:MAG: hypothetical protein ABIL58_03815 [Pseudomonadota bacterium]